MGHDVGADDKLEGLTNKTSQRNRPIIGCDRSFTFFEERTDICNAPVLSVLCLRPCEKVTYE